LQKELGLTGIDSGWVGSDLLDRDPTGQNARAGSDKGLARLGWRLGGGSAVQWLGWLGWAAWDAGGELTRWRGHRSSLNMSVRARFGMGFVRGERGGDGEFDGRFEEVVWWSEWTGHGTRRRSAPVRSCVSAEARQGGKIGPRGVSHLSAVLLSSPGSGKWRRRDGLAA
jgi:hypothetical protein